jgi:hypothetical protein
MFKTPQLLLGIFACWVCHNFIVIADVGDVLAESNFRDQTWKINSEKGKEAGFLEQNPRQVWILLLSALLLLSLILDYDNQGYIGLKDNGNVLWYFESPASWLPVDGVSMYNGTLEYNLLSVSWTGSFQTRASDFDIVLVSSKARLSLGNRFRVYTPHLNAWISYKMLTFPTSSRAETSGWWQD